MRSFSAVPAPRLARRRGASFSAGVARLLLLLLSVAACGPPRSIPVSAHARAMTLSVQVHDLEQDRVSCDGVAPERVTVRLDGASVGTVRIPCSETFVAPPRAHVVTLRSPAGEHLLEVHAARRDRKAQLRIVLQPTSDRGGHSSSDDACLSVWVGADGVRIESPTAVCPGVM
jgi:hypothetical protein